jgi:hypothetical protein
MIKKEPQSFVHCGSFDHPDLQSLNDYKFFFSHETLLQSAMQLTRATHPTSFNRAPPLLPK